jgi:hypothetical protein
MEAQSFLIAKEIYSLLLCKCNNLKNKNCTIKIVQLKYTYICYKFYLGGRGSYILLPLLSFWQKDHKLAN